MGLPEKIHLEIVTPEKHLFSGGVDSVTVPATTGYLKRIISFVRGVSLKFFRTA
jgi:hypothetical protein